jgi:hypothetical protein
MSLDPAKVAAELGVTPDQRVIDCTAAAAAWVEARRCLTDPFVLWADPAVEHGGVLYATLLFKQRSQPQGFAGMDALGTFSEDTGAIMSQVYRLVGADVVIA